MYGVMNILQVAPYFPPYLGGQEKHVSLLTSNLRDKGHEVKVLTSDYPPDETAQDREDLYRLPVLTRVLRNPIVSPRKEIIELFRWADVVHTHNTHASLSNIAALVGRYVETPMVLTCHGQFSFRNPVVDFIESLYTRSLGAATLQEMDRVVALSPADRDYLISLGVAPAAIDIIPNAIETPQLPPDSLVEKFQDRYNLHGREVILFIGPLLRRKSPETLIRAMPAIKKNHPNVVAVFVGDGEYLRTAKAKAQSLGLEDVVEFTGYLSEKKLLAAYRSGSILAFPSVSEGLPTTIMEGMFHELPVVATDLEPIRNWFEDYALLVDSEPDAFAGAISHLLSNDDLAERMGREGGEYVRRRFTWNRVSTEFEEVYHELVKGTGTSSQDAPRKSLEHS